MAFALIIVMIFVLLAGFFFLRVILGGLQDDVNAQNDERSMQMAADLTYYPEFSWSSNRNRCEKCMDLDKVLALKNAIKDVHSPYRDFFGKDVVAMRVDILYPAPIQTECTSDNYPHCSTFTLINKSSSITLQGSYVSLCRPDTTTGKFRDCVLGLVRIGLNKTTP